MCRFPTPTLLLGLLLAIPYAAGAQNVTVDEGVFLLFRGDEQVGTEEFSIRRLGAGGEARILANAVVEMDSGTDILRQRPVLEAEADGDAVSYQNRLAGDGETEVGIQAADRRFIARIRSAAGERERELRRTPDVVLLEGTVAHQYYFLAAQAAAGSTIPVIVPHTGEQVRAQVTDVSQDRVRIAGTSVDVRRVTLDVGGESRQIWFDDENRVLQLSIAARDFRAERESL